MELQQSELYQTYIRLLGWRVIKMREGVLFLKHVPFLGTLCKMQRMNSLPSPKVFIPLLAKEHVRTLAVEPASIVSQKSFSAWLAKIKPRVRINSSAFIPTKTLLIDLVPRDEEIFHRFTEAKRRAVRRAIKLGIRVEESSDIDAFIRIKNKSAGFLGFITTYGLKKLWKLLAPKHATLLLAYRAHTLVGGIFLIFWEKTAYYWVTGTTKQGKKLFAPTLLVWEALKLSKKRGCKQFDFVGVWDERLPNQNREWLGFTKFKEGFGTTSLYYPIASQ